MPLDQHPLTSTNGFDALALPELSKRQQEILAASTSGATDKVIADQLQISARTLEGHWRAIHRKLGSLNRCQAGFLFAALRENPHGNARA